jgi:hypothetical protein
MTMEESVIGFTINEHPLFTQVSFQPNQAPAKFFEKNAIFSI